MTIDLNTKFPKGGGGPYIVTISGEDTCQHSATVTLTIGTYNAVSHIKCRGRVLNTTFINILLISWLSDWSYNMY